MDLTCSCWKRGITSSSIHTDGTFTFSRPIGSGESAVIRGYFCERRSDYVREQDRHTSVL